ncbi:hypothetical protein INT44_005628 [Umbelopsis vinacea]|uniref:Uncharacterized protein n=1 Tax=Umbelopsis vinacea TaxID=44442 RepID=A0A8H7UKX6_9FUNG|nr:hypothetical protein INT44_005628 [Umbelopsis vinacea]
MLRTVNPEFQQPQSEGTEVLNQENILSTIQRVHDKSHLGIQNTWAKLRLQYEGYQMFAMKDAQPKDQHPTNTNGNYHLKITYNRALRTSRPYPPLSDGQCCACNNFVSNMSVQWMCLLNTPVQEEWIQPNTRLSPTPISRFAALPTDCDGMKKMRINCDVAATHILLLSRNHRDKATAHRLDLDLTTNENKFKHCIIELIRTRYVDPFLSGLFDDPDEGIYLRWTNEQTLEARQHEDLSNKRPDICISRLHGITWASNLGYGEAKSAMQGGNNYSICRDLLRFTFNAALFEVENSRPIFFIYELFGLVKPNQTKPQ